MAYIFQIQKFDLDIGIDLQASASYIDAVCIYDYDTVRSSHSHGDVIKWKHFPCYLPLVRGIKGEFPSQRPVTQSFDVFADLRLNKRLSKQSKSRWFETPPRSL